jgi:predicted DNA-binding transcriptional regulator YafY
VRASRLLSILILLQLRVRLTAEALAQEFRVSVRTIYRDIDELSGAGIPIYGERGPGGGFQLLDGYRTRLTGLAKDEAQAMLMIGLPGPAAALGMGDAATRAKGKLLASLPAPLSDDAGSIGSRFHLDPVDWYRAAEPVVHLPALARAVLDQRRVAMRYASWTDTRDWQVEPLGLVLKAGAWYAVARADAAPRTFKVANVLALDVLPEGFERPADFDLAGYWSSSLTRFEERLRPSQARLRVSPLGRQRLPRLGAYALRALDEAGAPDADGWTPVVLPIEGLEQAALALLGLGPEVDVLEPEALRTHLRALAEAIVQRAR